MTKHNPYPTGSNNYYKWEANQAGFTDVGAYMRDKKSKAPKCPHCGIPQGFAMGTGDCGCQPDY